MFELVQKLRNLNQKLQGLHKREYVDVVARAEEAQCELLRVQELLHADMFNLALHEKEREVDAQFRCLNENALSLLSQRAKAQWLQQVDRNTKFLYALLQQQQYRSRILTLFQTFDGSQIVDYAQLCNHIVDFYKG